MLSDCSEWRSKKRGHCIRTDIFCNPDIIFFGFRGDSSFNDFPDLRKIVWNTVPAVFTCDHCSFNYFCKVLPFCIINCLIFIAFIVYKIISTTNKNNNNCRYYYEKPKSVQKLNTLSPVSSS